MSSILLSYFKTAKILPQVSEYSNYLGSENDSTASRVFVFPCSQPVFDPRFIPYGPPILLAVVSE